MLRQVVLLQLLTLIGAMDLVPLPVAAKYKERKIQTVVIEKAPLMILGEYELRRLEPYFVKQAWNWGQLYDVACTRNPHPGSCLKSLTRWFFYPTFSKCYAFIYRGCGGTANKFLSEAQCIQKCVPRQRPLRPPPVYDEPTMAPPPDTAELNAMLASKDNITIEKVRKLADLPPTQPTSTPTEQSSEGAVTTVAAAAAATAVGAPPSDSTEALAAASVSLSKPKSKRDSYDAMNAFEFDADASQDIATMDRIIL